MYRYRLQNVLVFDIKDIQQRLKEETRRRDVFLESLKNKLNMSSILERRRDFWKAEAQMELLQELLGVDDD